MGNLIAHYRDIDLDAFVVMPNHVHAIIVLADGGGTRHGIPEIVRGFKTFSARSVNELRETRGALCQRGYYEHVIRNETALDRPPLTDRQTASGRCQRHLGAGLRRGIMSAIRYTTDEVCSL